MALWVVKSTQPLVPPFSTCLACLSPSPRVSSSSSNLFARGLQDRDNRERDPPACPCVADSPTSSFSIPREDLEEARWGAWQHFPREFPEPGQP